MRREDLFAGFEYRDGIWHASGVRDVSYPQEGNQICYEVEDRSFWFIHRNRCISALVKKYLPKGGLVLDVGGGNGYVAHELAKEGCDVVLLEPFLAGCVNAKQRGLTSIVCSDLDRAQFPKNSFDAIGLFDVLEHIADRAAFLKRIHDLLRPGGKLFITVPAFQWLWSDEDVDAGHYLRYTKRILQRETEDAGFERLFDSYFFSLLVLPIGLLRVLPSKLGVKPNGDARKDHAEAEYLQKALRFEVNRLKNGKSIGMGSSLVGVFGKT